ncbi:MAG: hypothetical protein GIX03_00045 [Candidatus Eremiobacteraeota bacterium]|nr:hypothetical protein [Candidatus Eremiobacteraeota bacterium]MBC5801413.1 hypothetical protein [Candidatus Eremiobacteraeota bacterium]MBC5825525.1 hypothetical protein [Candidatus Eremiobacteraeota bacterium]
MAPAKVVPLLVLSASLFGAASARTGVFALQGGTQKTTGHLAVRAVAGKPLVRELDFWMTRNGSATPVRRYQTDMTKLLHGVIVSDDFTTFLHVHPLFSNNGHFALEQRFPRRALYHVYADGEPLGIGQQVFRFDINVGPTRRSAPRELMPTGPVTMAGPYTVTLSRLRLSTQGETMLNLRIRRGDKLARDLHPYLGTLGHAVFLNGKDLTYVHVHPMALGAGSARSAMSPNGTMPSAATMEMPAQPLRPSAVIAANMLLNVAVREPGTYKLWFQFRGGDALRVASFVLTASRETAPGSVTR